MLRVEKAPTSKAQKQYNTTEMPRRAPLYVPVSGTRHAGELLKLGL